MKKVVKNIINYSLIEVDKCNEDKIYAFIGLDKKIYKVQRIGDLWAFVSMVNSACLANGCFQTLKDAIMRNSDVYEFESQREFFTWALENSK